MWLAWLAAANAQQITLGAGGAAVLDPGFAPSAVATSAGTVLDVVPSPPVLLLFGLRAGTSTLTVERADGPPATWTVKVEPSPAAPSGGPGLVGTRETLVLPAGGAAVCTVPGGPATARTGDGLGVTAFGPGRWLVWTRGEAGDLVVEHERTPRVLAVSVGSGAVAGPSCVVPTETVRLRVGEVLELPLGRALEEVWIGQPDVAYATTGAPGAARLTGVRPGTTTLVARDDGGRPQLRAVVVVP